MVSKELSVLLLDNGQRERFHTLDWLAQQSVPRDRYELIWVECYDREVEAVKRKADKLLTLHQEGRNDMHKALNAGIIAAEGRIITMCDSDAIFPPEWVASVLDAFSNDQRLVLMHHEGRALSETYPDGETLEQIQKHHFDVWPNVGACLSILRRDAIGFGGVDEHHSYCGVFCGPCELTWRMINSGVPEVWHDTVQLYHFRHSGSDGEAARNGGAGPTQQHIKGHNLTAVEGFRQGRLLPLVENAEIHKLRMDQRIIGTDFEKGFAW